jgi:Pyruvate/2-oxoacid:ferredoxin oxidoreductase delta subunit
MLKIIIDWDRCQACDPCEARLVCNTRAIVQIDRNEPPYIDVDRCNQCGLCVEACCCDAISLRNTVNSVY